MINFISFYTMMSMLLVIPLIRAIAIARDFGRYPRVLELVLGAKLQDKGSARSVRIAIRCSVGLSLFILWGWQGGYLVEDIQRGGISIFWGMSVYNFTWISFAARSVYFNVFHRRIGMSVKEENNAFHEEFRFLPGFSDRGRTLITLSTLMSILCLTFMLLTQI